MNSDSWFLSSFFKPNYLMFSLTGCVTLKKIIPLSLLNEVKAMNSIRDSKLGVGGSLRWINFRDSTTSTGSYKV